MAEQSRQAKSIFLAAIEEHMPERWSAFLEQACAGDVFLRARVEKLLHAQATLGSFHEARRSALPATLDEPITERPGSIIGPYKLLEQIGEGGFGIVFMAEQEKPIRRQVALKVLKPGMDTKQVIARFESERQALALMDHPNIARVLDAGATDSGRPYFVMELVKGVSITEFCDNNRMAPEVRLKLFIDVCHAIQHAHHKGIIHRDIKPTNVMVTLHDGVPVVKVIDFGIAKATVQKLTERTLFTAYGQMIGTLEYMSPEQAEMSELDIDTRSDVYALGVLLYELLTGTTPLEGKRLRQAGYAELLRLIREEEAPRPSTRLSSLGDTAKVLAGNRGLDVRRLTQLLAGDLDWVAMKALEKDRNRRYDTPGSIAADVDRYLGREPIVARPPSTVYKVRKFTQRHRAAVLTAAAVAVLLLGGAAMAVLEQSCYREQAWSPKPVKPSVPDGDAYQTFVDGAGI
jgi:serine/threonine protein kinase